MDNGKFRHVCTCITVVLVLGLLVLDDWIGTFH